MHKDAKSIGETSSSSSSERHVEERPLAHSEDRSPRGFRCGTARMGNKLMKTPPSTQE